MIGKLKSMGRRLWRDERGQALLFFAISSLGLIALTGLVVDGGMLFLQRTRLQAAADAGTKAALRTIATHDFTLAEPTCSTTETNNVGSVITTYVQANVGTSVTPTWTFIDNNSNTVASTSACTSATGVRVTAPRTYDTFFLNIVGIRTTSAQGAAAGRVKLSGFAGESPFVVCGTALLFTAPSTTTATNLFSSTNPYTINPSLVGATFILHWSQLSQSGGGGCAGGNSSFKGRAGDDSCADEPAAIPGYMCWDNGTQAGPTSSLILNACGGTLINCTIVVPLAEPSGSGGCTGTAPSQPVCVVAWAAFQVGEDDPPGGNLDGCNQNCHYGILLGATINAQSPSIGPWTPGQQALVTTGLVE